jgi:hypothetical protein
MTMCARQTGLEVDAASCRVLRKRQDAAGRKKRPGKRQGFDAELTEAMPLAGKKDQASGKMPLPPTPAAAG